MSRLSSFLVAGLAVAGFAAVVNADIKPIDPFTGDAQEAFSCRVSGDPCMAPDCPTMFGSEDNTLCTPGKSGCHTTSFWIFKCTMSRRSSPDLFGSSNGWVRYTFDPPVAKFGGYFGTNAANPGQNNDPTLTFRDKDGNELGKAVQPVGDGDCKWYWGGWESTGAPIAEIDVVGKLMGGAYIQMDDMEISYPAQATCKYNDKKVKARRCETCPDKRDCEVDSEAACENVEDCKKRIKTKIACPGDARGKCKIISRRCECS